MRSLIILFLATLAWCSVKAQYSDSLVHYAGYTSSGTFNKTSTSRAYLFNNILKFGIRKKKIELNSTNNFLYGSQDSRLTNNDFSSVWDMNVYSKHSHFYYWGLFNYNSTYSLKVNNQLLAGGGVAYNVVHEKNLKVNVSDGILYDYSDITTQDNTRKIYHTPRNSLRLQVKGTFKNIFTFNGNGFLQNSLQNQNDYIIKSNITFAVKIKKWLSLTSAFTYNRMSRTRSENLFVTYGLSIEKYF